MRIARSVTAVLAIQCRIPSRVPLSGSEYQRNGEGGAFGNGSPCAHKGEALEFFKPVEDDVDLAGFLFFLDHQETLPIGRDIKFSPGRFHLKQDPGTACSERLSCPNGYHHHVEVGADIEKLAPVG